MSKMEYTTGRDYDVTMCDYCRSDEEYELKKDTLFKDFDIKLEEQFAVGGKDNVFTASGRFIYEDAIRAVISVGDDGLWLGIWSVSLDEHDNLPIDLEAKVKIKYCPMCGRKLGEIKC